MSRFVIFSPILMAIACVAAAGEDPRLAVPPKAEQDKARKLVRELFKEDYAKKGAAEAKALSVKLLSQSRETKDDPSSQYVLLQEARDLALRGNDLSSAIAVAEELGRTFAVDGLSEKASVLESAAGSSTSANAKTIAEKALEVCDDMLAKEEFATAARALKAAKVAAGKLTFQTLTKVLAEREKELKSLQTEFDKAKAALDKLDTMPGDKAACLDAGKYLCMRRGDWERGLQLLAKTDEPMLAGIAKKEMQTPKNAAEQVKLGDEWWDVAEASPEPEKSKWMRRSVYWYQQALPELTGLAKTKCEKRIASVPKGGDSTGVIAEPPKSSSTKHTRLVGQTGIRIAESTGLLDPANKPFTVEAWVRNAGAAKHIPIFGDNGEDPKTGKASGLWMWVGSTGDPAKLAIGVALGSRGNGDWFLVKGQARKSDSEWHHYALCKSAGAVRIFRDGQLEASASCEGVPFFSGVGPIRIGGVTTNDPIDVRAFRITGSALYEKSFTPPATFTKTKDTLVLLDFPNATAKQVPDVSGHKHYGTIVEPELPKK